MEEPMAETNLQVLLRRRPKGEPVAEYFEIVETPVPEPKEGEVLVRHRYLSLDPYMRGRMADAKSYAKPVELGAVMEGRTAGEVVASKAPGFAPGDTVAGGFGWQRFSCVKAAGLMKIDPKEAPLSAEGRRDDGGFGCVRRRRPSGRADRQDQGLQGHRHRRRGEEVPVRDRGARLRRLHRPSRRPQRPA